MEESERSGNVFVDDDEFENRICRRDNRLLILGNV